MVNYFLTGAVKAGIVLEADAVATGFSEDSTAWATTNFGLDGDPNSLYDGAAGTPTYAVITHKASASIDTFGPTYDTYQSLEDDFDHDIEIRATGSGSMEFVPNYNTDGVGTIPYHRLIYAGTYYPNGFTIDAGSDLYYKPEDDTATTKATDMRGYAVVVEQHITGTTWYMWTFHNAKISCSPAFGPQKATRATLSWEDARYIDFEIDTSATFGNHADA